MYARRQKETVKKLESELAQREEAFDKAKIVHAKNIKDAARYSSAYNKNKFYAEYRALSIRKILPDDEYQKALTAIRAEPRPTIPLFKNNFIQASVKEYVSDILNQTPVNITIESLKKDARISNWAEQGLAIHEQMSSIEAAQKVVEHHLISEKADEIASFETSVETKRLDLGTETERFKQLTRQINNLEQEVKNSQIPADSINKDIEFIMGRNELVFSNSALGYQITRKGKRAKNLSKGEENAIALIYFFNTFLDVNADAQNTIVILDDPISSFDSNFYYNAISYIREKTSQVGQTFIFTHKFSLLKDYSLMYGGNTNQYIKAIPSQCQTSGMTIPGDGNDVMTIGRPSFM